MSVSIPEHTVDIWAGIAIGQAFPNAGLWAPTPRGPDRWDVGLRRAPGDGKIVIFENKGNTALKRQASDGAPDHNIAIWQKQLREYVMDPKLKNLVYYVLPRQPWSVPGPGPIPDEAHHWPTAGQWMWVVSAMDLDAYLGARKSLRSSEPALGALPARTLDQFLAELRDCRDVDSLAVFEGEEPPRGERGSRGRAPSVLASFIPYSDLSDLGRSNFERLRARKAAS